ncbi:uncharacterized protein LOC129565633 [Sitodiplosis mosellana]|uniref:uncharacterized protein LOC129565633 n=1 Tax=Sitodiplosis mosellana TaxID=263140 RepID=UPI002444011B|nr:uncharacterized protein LOC129565633 [Sitodiplosis mosellana]
MALISDSLKFDMLVISVGAATLLYLFFKRTYSYWERKGFKSAPNINYIFGNFKRSFLAKENFAETIDTLYRSTNEPFIGIYTILRPVLLLRDPELIRSVLVKDFSHFTDRGIHCNEDYDPLSANLLALPGQRWKSMRGKLTPTFTSGKLKAMFSTLVNCGATLQNYLAKLADKNEFLDVREISASHATNVIASVAFGIDVDSINNPNNEFRVCGRKIFELSLSNAIRTLMTFTAPKLLGLLRIKSIQSDVESFINSVVKQTLVYRETNNVSRKDFFQLLIQLRNTGTVQLDDQWDTVIKADENQKTMTFNEIAAQTFVFFAAGFETSSTTLTFCMYELARNPDIQEKVHDEIISVIERHGGEITYECVSEMKYLEKCIDETLRLYAVASFLTRSCVKEYHIPGTNQVIEKGVEVFVPVFSLHRDEKYYETPLEFNPDRFNETNSEGKNQINKPYIPFGDGPRNCIGMRLGKMQTKVGLVMLLQKFKFELEDNRKNRELVIDPKSFLLSPHGGLMLKVSKRFLEMSLITASLIGDAVLVFTAAISSFYLYLLRNYSYWDRKGFKTLPGFIYVFGHMKSTFSGKDSIASLIKKLYSATNEPFIGIYTLLRPVLLIRDPELIRTIFIKDFNYFTDRGLHSNEEYDPLSGHLLVLSGEKWKNLRAKLTPTFTTGKLKAMFSTLVDCGESLQNHLEKVANNGELLDVRETSASYSTNVIASVAFGIDVDAIRDPNNQFRVYGRKIFATNVSSTIRRLLAVVAPKLMEVLRIKTLSTDIQNFFTSLVKKNLELREQNNIVRKDFFQLLIQLRNTGTVHSDDQWETVIKTDENQKQMTINEIAAQSLVFFGAGFETSSTTLSYCLYELAKKPEIQQRVHEEIDQVLEKHDGQISYESISEMKFLENCIEETLRKYPPVPILPRLCGQNYQIPGTNQVIEKGTQVMIPVFALHRDNQYYEDPEKFMPERFNEENSAGKNILNRPYIPFGVGPRNCIGIRMGKMQTKVGLVLMLQKIRFESEDKQRNNELAFSSKTFILTPTGEINLKIYKR